MVFKNTTKTKAKQEITEQVTLIITKNKKSNTGREQLNGKLGTNPINEIVQNRR